MLSPQKLPLSARESFSPAKYYERDTKKYDHVFASDAKNFSIQYDQNCGTLDFFSKKLAPSRKCFERIVSFKPKDNGNFQYVSAFYDGSEVSEEWICEKISSFTTTIATKSLMNTIINENIERTNILQQDDIAVITPDDSSNANMNNNNKRKSTFYDLSILLKISTKQIQEFLSIYFSCDLNAAVERNIKLTTNNMNTTTTSTDDTNGTTIPEYIIKPILISIEGNIGAGKSYLLTNLRKAHPEWCFIDEPVEFWESLKNDSKQSLLEVFYQDQRRWSYTFQNCALLSRFNNIETAITDYTINAKAKYMKEQELLPENERYSSTTTTSSKGSTARIVVPQVFITERCLDTDHEVFAKMLHADGQLDNLEYDLYQRWFNLLGKSATPLSAIVYVDTIPTTCSERITLRSRDGESGIPLAYLTSLDSFQRDWIDSTKVPTVRTLSDNMKHVENFVSELIENASSMPTPMLQ